MALRWRQKVALAKIESVYDTDAVPTGAADAVLMRNVEITPLEADEEVRELVRTYRGGEITFLTNHRVSINFSVELAAAGTKDVAPAYGALLRGCALSETITATTDVQYDPISASDESLTVHFHIDGQKHPITGCRGNAKIAIKAGQVPMLDCAFIGTYVAPTALADPTPTLTAWKDPKPGTKANTPTVSLHGYTAILEELGLDLGNDVKRIARIGDERTEIDGRKTTGNIIIEAPALGTKDFFAIVKAETTGALQLIHGSGDGNIVQIDAPNVQLLKPRYTESEGTAMLAMDLGLIPGASGDDELKITTK